MKKIKDFIKSDWKFILFLIFFYIFMTYKLPYVIYTPGGSIDMNTRVTGENTYPTKGSFNMTYVSMVRGSTPFILLSYVIPNWDLVPSEKVVYEDVDLEETIKIDKIYMDEAISNAEYVAYNKAGIDYKETDIKNKVTFIDKNALTKLEPGDQILEIDGNKFKSLKEFQEYVSLKKVGDTIKIKYLRDNKEKFDDTKLISINGIPKVGIGIATISKYETPYDIKIKTKHGESGPSGGLMTTLEIYNKITKTDITKGLKIMGTGTIDKNGNVGEIGGVKYKLIGAVKDKADVFICPDSNYKEALKTKKENKFKIEIISAKTFDEALKKIEKLNL